MKKTKKKLGTNCEQTPPREGARMCVCVGEGWSSLGRLKIQNEDGTLERSFRSQVPSARPKYFSPIAPPGQRLFIILKTFT